MRSRRESEGHVNADILTQRQMALRLLVLAAPIIATNISRTAMSFIDFVMVSELGTDAQAAVMPAGLVLQCVIAFGVGTMAAVNTYASQSLGRGRLSDCSAYAWQGLYLSLILGVLALPAWFAVEPFFTWVDHGPKVVPLQVVYAQIGIFGIGPTIAAAALAHFFTGVHKPGVGLVSVLISNLLNVAANYALIFGHWGFPKMGIAGAAWGTLAAVLCQMLILLCWWMLPAFGARFGAWHTWRPNGARLKGLLLVGLPVGGQFSVDLLTWTIYTLFLIGQFGKEQLAANNICFKFLEISFMPAVGLGMALTATIGKAIGQGRRDLARMYVRLGMIFTSSYMGVVGIAMILFRHELPGLLTQDESVLAWAAPMMILGGCFQVFDGMTIVFNGALRGAGDTAWPAVATVVCAAVVLLGGGYLLALVFPAWGCLGPWMMATLYIIVLGTILWARFASGRWERVVL